MGEVFDINKPLMLHDGTPVRLHPNWPQPDDCGWYGVQHEDGTALNFFVFDKMGQHYDNSCPPLRNRPEDVCDNEEFASGEELEFEIEQLRAWKAAAIERHPDLAPVDPYLKRAREILVTVVDQSDATDIMRGDWDDEYSIKSIIRALKEGMGDE